MFPTRPHTLRRLLANAALTLLGSLAATGAVHAAACDPTKYPADVPAIDTGLPSVHIWTLAGAQIVDKDNYVTACMRLHDGSSQPYAAGLFTGTIKIKGRGNSTWDMPKKPYRIKLDTAAAVLDMPSHKDWVLLANYTDKTLMRNAVAMEFSRRVGMPWTPRLRPVDLYLNGVLQGSYQLGEKIEVDVNRVNIRKMADADVALPNLAGGYLIEADYTEYIGTDTYFTTALGINFVMSSPSGAIPAQVNYIKNATQAVETAILSRNTAPGTGYASLFDLDSLINFYLVQELMKNADSPFFSSVYLQKDVTGPMRMGPLWDFDLSAGNADFDPALIGPTGWWVRGRAPWIDTLLKDRNFKSQLVARWKEMKPQFQSINTYIAAQQVRLNKSQAANYAVWPTLDTYVWPNSVVLGSYPAEVTYLNDWLQKRIVWMDKNIAK